MTLRRASTIARKCHTHRLFSTSIRARTLGAGIKSLDIGNSYSRASPLFALQRRFKAGFIDYDAFEKCITEHRGEQGTLDWRLHFKSSDVSDKENVDPADEGQVSCWHDIPLVIKNTGMFNYVNEIPKGDLAKMECATKERWNPIKQDVKKGKLRFFTYGTIPFNYGFLPQTWEDPTRKSEFSDADTFGDNDPVDVVELSETPLGCGQISSVKILGLLGLIDEGETDWKVLALDNAHKSAGEINSIDDVDKVLGAGTLDSVRDWFKMYKTTDGKPENNFTHGGEFLSADKAVEVIDECHKHWKDLVLNKVESKLDKTSHTMNCLTAQGGDEETLNKILTEAGARGVPKLN